jgi:hypothetical protein
MAMSWRGERDRVKERFWRTMVRQWQQSGLSVREFCGDRDLGEANFYAWRRTIADRDQQARRQRNGDRHPPRTGSAVFVPVRVTDPAPLVQTATLEVVLGQGRLVRVPVGFDAGTLRQLLAVLQEAPPC